MQAMLKGWAGASHKNSEGEEATLQLRTRNSGANYQMWGKLQTNKISHHLKKKQKKKPHGEMKISSLLQALWHLFSQRTECLTLTSEAIDFPWSKQEWCEEYFKHTASTCEFRGAPLEGRNGKHQCILFPTQYSSAVDRQWSYVNFKDLRESHRDPASSSN